MKTTQAPIAAAIVMLAITLAAIPTLAARQSNPTDDVDAPENLRFRKSAEETLLLWDQPGTANSWTIEVDGAEVATVFEQRFEVEALTSPHIVTAENGGTRTPSAPLTFYQPEATTGPDDPRPVASTDSADAADVILGKHLATAPTWTKPAIDAPYRDATYGSTIRRLTSAEGTRFNRNTYSRRQAESPDGKHFFTYHGDADYRVYNRATAELVSVLDIHPDSEPQWHPTNSDRIRYLRGPNGSSGELTLQELQVSTGDTRVIADLTNRIQARWASARYLADRAEGSPSADGDRYAWIVHDSNEKRIGIVSYDLSTDTILGFDNVLDGDQDGNGVGLLDWTSASPSGRYIVAGYWNRTVVYDADLTNPRTINNKADHSDIARNLDGSDAYVYMDFSAEADGGWLMSINLETMERTRLFNLYKTNSNTSIHISGKAYDNPGWVVVSTYDCKVDLGWACNKVMAVELAGENRIVNLAHTQNCGDNYWTETHAVVNRDASRVYFNSDGGSCGIDAEVYELTVPPLR